MIRCNNEVDRYILNTMNNYFTDRYWVKVSKQKTDLKTWYCDTNRYM